MYSKCKTVKCHHLDLISIPLLCSSSSRCQCCTVSFSIWAWLHSTASRYSTLHHQQSSGLAVLLTEASLSTAAVEEQLTSFVKFSGVSKREARLPSSVPEPCRRRRGEMWGERDSIEDEQQSLSRSVKLACAGRLFQSGGRWNRT